MSQLVVVSWLKEETAFRNTIHNQIKKTTKWNLYPSKHSWFCYSWIPKFKPPLRRFHTWVLLFPNPEHILCVLFAESIKLYTLFPVSSLYNNIIFIVLPFPTEKISTLYFMFGVNSSTQIIYITFLDYWIDPLHIFIYNSI